MEPFVISSRIGAALALLLSVVALGLAVGAFFAAIADDDEEPQSLVQTRLTNEYAGSPQLFPLHDFYAGAGTDGVLRAFYVYPPGFTGHVRGCRITWNADAVEETDDGDVGPGLYADPCSGARWDADGQLVAGNSERALDEFPTQAGVEGVLVDTSRLICGESTPTTITPTPVAGPTPTPTPEGERECDRVVTTIP